MQRTARLTITASIVVAALLLRMGIEAAFFLGFLAASVSGLVTYKASLIAGLICLICCPIVLVIDRSAWLQQSPLVNYYAVRLLFPMGYSPTGTVNELAIRAYYFLCIGTITLIMHYSRIERRKAEQR